MKLLLNLLNNNMELVLISILLIVTATLIILAVLLLKHSKLKRRLSIFFEGSKAHDLEELLAEQIKRTRNLDKELKKIIKEQTQTHKIALKGIQKVGVVRFNPFKSTGGDQSFSIALLDSSDSGLVISSLHTRTGTRIYAKPIENRTSGYNLSKEETKAINIALKK